MPAVTIDSAHPMPPPADASSVLAACLRRCAARGLRLVVTAPSETRLCARGIARFPERRSELALHAQWSSAYRVFCGGREHPYDRASWRILAVDADRRVVGAITARFVCGELVREHLYASELLEATGPVFREACEAALGETFAAAQQHGGTPAEISHWSVEGGPHGPLLCVTLMRAMAALAMAFAAPVALLAANHRRAESGRFTRWGGLPLGREGRFFLPPFLHRVSGASLRFMVLEADKLGARARAAAADLAVLRASCPIICAP